MVSFFSMHARAHACMHTPASMHMHALHIYSTVLATHAVSNTPGIGRDRRKRRLVRERARMLVWVAAPEREYVNMPVVALRSSSSRPTKYPAKPISSVLVLSWTWGGGWWPVVVVGDKW